MVGAVPLARVALDAGTRGGMGDRVVPGVLWTELQSVYASRPVREVSGDIMSPLSPEKQIDLSFAP